MQLVGLIRFAQFVFPVIAICYYLFVLPQPITDPFPVNDRFVSRKDARVLLYEKYYPVENAKATVIISHGWAEHAGRYEHVAQTLNENGYNVYTFDYRGHGHSSGLRCASTDLNDMVADLEQVVTERVPKLAKSSSNKVAILGHSMGALHSIVALSKNRKLVDLLILSGAFVKLAEQHKKPLLLKLLSFLAKYVPSLPVEGTLSTNHITRNATINRAYDTDKLNCRSWFRACTGYAIVSQLTKYANVQTFKTIELPLLMVHGEKDKIAEIDGAELAFKSAASTDKTWKAWPDMLHEPLNDLEREEVLQEITTWLNKRV